MHKRVELQAFVAVEFDSSIAREPEGVGWLPWTKEREEDGEREREREREGGRRIRRRYLMT
jgi:hypothetical protein